MPSIAIVERYFDKKRPLATGIAVCGSGIGTFIFSPMVEYISETYDWRSMPVIVGGVLLNGDVCGILFRPLNTNMYFQSISDKSAKTSIDGKRPIKNIYIKGSKITFLLLQTTAVSEYRKSKSMSNLGNVKKKPEMNTK